MGNICLGTHLFFWLVLPGGAEDEVQRPALQVQGAPPGPPLVRDPGVPSSEPGSGEVRALPGSAAASDSRALWLLH